jgi:hypothetical protein
MNTIDVNTNRALKRTQINKLNEKDEKEEKLPETYPVTHQKAISMTGLAGNKASTRRAYDVASKYQSLLSQEEQAKLNKLIPKTYDQRTKRNVVTETPKEDAQYGYALETYAGLQRKVEQAKQVYQDAVNGNVDIENIFNIYKGLTGKTDTDVYRNAAKQGVNLSTDEGRVKAVKYMFKEIGEKIEEVSKAQKEIEEATGVKIDIIDY